jgi:hypothetical protein
VFVYIYIYLRMCKLVELFEIFFEKWIVSEFG